MLSWSHVKQTDGLRKPILTDLLLSFIAVNLCSMWDVRLQESANNETNPNSIFKSVRVHLRESVRLQEWVNTQFDWEVKTGIEKSVRSRAVRLREC